MAYGFDHCLQRVVPPQESSPVPGILRSSHGIPYDVALCGLHSQEVPILHARPLLLRQPQCDHPILLLYQQQGMV